ncbi:TPA: hypothetical protein L4900_003619 [Pseudomonas aeruginosa]|nr:hypothetical protein [Pseudomonas aeruginosa]HBO7437694.1 hypothetical protein [Pseudomonas aeruginosa]HBO7462168.1 hypothetical protein [Pseudomonas aeruginosa]
MELDLLKNLIGSTGLGGFCVGVLFLLFRKIIGAKFLSKMTKEHSFKIINRIIVFTFFDSYFRPCFLVLPAIENQRRTCGEEYFS